MKIKKLNQLFLFLLAGIFLLAGCGQKGEADPATLPGPAAGSCTVLIECANILENLDKLDSAKKEFLPDDGWILTEYTVEFAEGETAFDVLKRACKQQDIQLSSKYTPIYDSYYVEGINQIYEFDCGSKSGWMYKVNGEYPKYGSSSYEVQDGDSIEWKYTCNLGTDVGGDAE